MAESIRNTAQPSDEGRFQRRDSLARYCVLLCTIAVCVTAASQAFLSWALFKAASPSDRATVAPPVHEPEAVRGPTDKTPLVADKSTEHSEDWALPKSHPLLASLRTIAANRAGGIPFIPNKPAPKLTTFRGCPPEGDGGDPDQNRLKNRVDTADWIPVSFDAVMNLSWPEGVVRKKRANWRESDEEEIARFEGTPISIEG